MAREGIVLQVQGKQWGKREGQWGKNKLGGGRISWGGLVEGGEIS